jgi:hypothetical protein
MSSLLTSIKGGVTNAQTSFLGPGYDYWSNIKAPSQMGMSENGSLGTLANNIAGIIGYVEVLVSGKGNASKTGAPLGNKFFLKTAATCNETNLEEWRKNKDKEAEFDRRKEEIETKIDKKQISEEEGDKELNKLDTDKKAWQQKKPPVKKVPRYIYINNVPDGRIPFISSAMGGTSFGTLKGLIPGTMGNIGALNPMGIFQSFTMGNNPECINVTMETVNANNARGTEAHHVALVEVMDMNPCWFSGKRNPASGETCNEAFSSMYGADGVKSLDGVPGLGTGAGASGFAYQNTARSPLSYNIGSGADHYVLSSSSFEPLTPEELAKSDGPASFFKSKLKSAGLYHDTDSEDSDEEEDESLFDQLMSAWSDALNRLVGPPNSNSSSVNPQVEDEYVQAYYAAIGLIMLYIMYRLLYKQRH